jgi:hypothetical protein
VLAAAETNSTIKNNYFFSVLQHVNLNENNDIYLAVNFSQYGLNGSIGDKWALFAFSHSILKMKMKK